MRRLEGDRSLPNTLGLEAELRRAGYWPSDEEIAKLNQITDEAIRRANIGDQLRAGINEDPGAAAVFSAEVRLIKAIADEVSYLNPSFLDKIVGFARELTKDIAQGTPGNLS